MITYDLMFQVPGRDTWHPAARDVDWRLLLGMVKVWRKANPDCDLMAVVSTEPWPLIKL